MQESTGFSHDVDNQLMNAPEVAEVEEWQKNVVLILDEMHGREDLDMTNIQMHWLGLQILAT